MTTSITESIVGDAIDRCESRLSTLCPHAVRRHGVTNSVL